MRENHLMQLCFARRIPRQKMHSQKKKNINDKWKKIEKEILRSREYCDRNERDEQHTSTLIYTFIPNEKSKGRYFVYTNSLSNLLLYVARF